MPLLAVAGLAGFLGEPVREGVVVAGVLLLVWLRQVAANLVQSPGLAHNPLWVLRNVVSVLRALPELSAVEKR